MKWFDKILFSVAIFVIFFSLSAFGKSSGNSSAQSNQNDKNEQVEQGVQGPQGESCDQCPQCPQCPGTTVDIAENLDSAAI